MSIRRLTHLRKVHRTPPLRPVDSVLRCSRECSNRTRSATLALTWEQTGHPCSEAHSSVSHSFSPPSICRGTLGSGKSTRHSESSRKCSNLFKTKLRRHSYSTQNRGP